MKRKTEGGEKAKIKCECEVESESEEGEKKRSRKTDGLQLSPLSLVCLQENAAAHFFLPLLSLGPVTLLLSLCTKY